jgi:hypothetical protein
VDTKELTPVNVTDNKVVIFVDILGFASLTETYPVEPDLIEAYNRPVLWSIETIFASRDNLLTRTFTSFHHSLKAAIDLAKMSHPVTAISFSDSAFIATTRLFEAANMAVYLFQSLLRRRVPVRIGIAHGSFAAIGFRSDVTVTNGNHAAHFLGTGVVRSYAASTCEIKGLRLLLHPSTVPLLNDSTHNPPSPDKDRIRYLQCSKEESSNTAGVGYEIDYWRFKPTAEVEAWHAFQDMWDMAPQVALKHYQATAEAINRMRIGQGEPGINNLRRRTLPHRNVHNS